MNFKNEYAMMQSDKMMTKSMKAGNTTGWSIYPHQIIYNQEKKKE